MEFRILGPLEVADEGRPVSIRRGKELALLAYLLLHANEVVPSERLIDELWDERPPQSAAKILHNAVSHLRKQLGNGRLVTREPGYLLRVADEELDLKRFERLAHEGRYREALGLWRGSPLLDLRDERFADDARRRLEDLRLAVLEDRIEADLAAGRHAELVPELEELIAAHPLRERLYAALMLALYRAGRQAHALETYQRARKTLSEELGLEPSPQLQALERKILEQHPDLAAPPRPPRQGPPSRRVGRRSALIGVAAAALTAAIVVGLLQVFDGGSSPPLARGNSLAVIDPSQNRVVDVVPLGSAPRGVAVNESGVWVTNPSDGTISWLNRKTLDVIQTIGIGAAAWAVATGTRGVWVTTGNDNMLVHLDGRTGGILNTIRLSQDDVSAAAWSVAVGEGAVWVTSGSRIVKIDVSTGAVVAENFCCDRPVDVATSPRGVWVADFVNHLVLVSPTTTKTRGRIDVGLYPDSVIAAYGSVWASVTDNFAQHAAVARFDPDTLRPVQTIPLGSPKISHRKGLQLAAGEGSIWVADANRGDILRIDPARGIIVARIHVGGSPLDVAVGANRVWVTVN